MSSPIPYNRGELQNGDFQVWQAHPEQFLVKNSIDLTPFFTTDWENTDDTKPLRAYYLMDGRMLISGQVTFIGVPGGIIISSNICDLSPIFSELIRGIEDITGPMPCVVQDVGPPPPGGANNEVWTVLVNFQNEVLRLLNIKKANADLLSINTGARTRISLEYLPASVSGI